MTEVTYEQQQPCPSEEKQTNKLYIPLLYLAPIGSLILVLNKYISTKQDLVEFASITKIFVYGYVGVFFIVIILLSAIGLKRENDPNINKPMIRSGLFLLLLCAGGLILILTIRGN